MAGISVVALEKERAESHDNYQTICQSLSMIDEASKLLLPRRKCTMPGKVRIECLALWRRLLSGSGQSQFLTAPSLAKPLQFNLSLDGPDDEQDMSYQPAIKRPADSDARLMEMLAAQAAHRDDGVATQDEDTVATDEKLSESEKKEILQKALNMAASNGDMDRIQRILSGKARPFVDLDAPDDEGTAPLIYASCFV